MDEAVAAHRITSSEVNIWFEAVTPDGSIWIESYSISEFKEKVDRWEGPGELALERVSQRVDYYEPVRHNMKGE